MRLAKVASWHNTIGFDEARHVRDTCARRVVKNLHGDLRKMVARIGVVVA